MVDRWVSLGVVLVNVGTHLVTLTRSNHDFGIIKLQHTLARMMQNKDILH